MTTPVDRTAAGTVNAGPVNAAVRSSGETTSESQDVSDMQELGVAEDAAVPQVPGDYRSQHFEPEADGTSSDKSDDKARGGQTCGPA